MSAKIAHVEDAVGSFCSNAPVVHYAGTTAYTTSGPAQLSAAGVIHRSLQAMHNGRLPMNPTPETKEEITPSMPLTAGVTSGGGAASVLSSTGAGGRAGTCVSSYCSM